MSASDPMFPAPRSARRLAACALTLILTAPLSAETLYLKDGRVLQGRIVRHTRTAIMLELPDGRTLELPKSRIARMRFDNPTAPDAGDAAREIQAEREAERRARAARAEATRRAAERRAADRRRREAEKRAAEAKVEAAKAAEEQRRMEARDRAAAETRAAEERRQAEEREREAAERLTLRTTPDAALPAPVVCLECPAARNPPGESERERAREPAPLSWSAGLQLSRARTGLQALLPDAAISSVLAGQLPAARSADQLRYGALLLGLQYERPQWFVEFEARGGDGEAESTYAGAGFNERIQGLSAEHELGGANLAAGYELFAGERVTLYGFAGLDVSEERARYASLGLSSAKIAGEPRDFLFLDPLFEDSLESGVWFAGLEIRRSINADWRWRVRHQFGYGAATFRRERASLGTGVAGPEFQSFYESMEGEAIVRSLETGITITRALDESAALDFTLARRRERYTFYDLRSLFVSGASYYEGYGTPAVFQGPTVRAVERSVSVRYRSALDWR